MDVALSCEVNRQGQRNWAICEDSIATDIKQKQATENHNRSTALVIIYWGA